MIEGSKQKLKEYDNCCHGNQDVTSSNVCFNYAYYGGEKG